VGNKINAGWCFDVGLDRCGVAVEIDDELRAIEAPLAIASIDLDGQQFDLIAVEPKPPVVVAVALNPQRRADTRPIDAEIEIEADFGHQPIRRLIILATRRDMGR